MTSRPPEAVAAGSANGDGMPRPWRLRSTDRPRPRRRCLAVTLAVSAGRLFALHEASVAAMPTATTGPNKRMNCITMSGYFAASIGSITLSKASISVLPSDACR